MVFLGCALLLVIIFLPNLYYLCTKFVCITKKTEEKTWTSVWDTLGTKYMQVYLIALEPEINTPLFMLIICSLGFRRYFMNSLLLLDVIFLVPRLHNTVLRAVLLPIKVGATQPQR